MSYRETACVILVVLGLMSSPRPLRAQDSHIPESLPAQKKENLSRFLNDAKSAKKDGLIPQSAQLSHWNPNVSLSFSTAPGQEVKQYLSAVIPHRAKSKEVGPDRADVYWYRPNPKRGSPGVTVKQVVDLNTGKAVGDAQVLIGYPAPLTNEEQAEAIRVAKESFPAVRDLLSQDKKDIVLEVLSETLANKSADGDPGDRVVSLRVRRKDESKLVTVNVNLTKYTARQP